MVNDTLSYLGVEVADMDADRLKELIKWERSLQRKDAVAIDKIKAHANASIDRQMILQEELTKRQYTQVPAFSYVPNPVRRGTFFFAGE